MTTFSDSSRPTKRRKTGSPPPDGEAASDNALSTLQQTLSTISPSTLETFKISLLSQISSRPQCTSLRNVQRINPFPESQYQKVHSLLSQTILAGEGNSMLIIGSRGSGKTTLVESVISNLSTDHKGDFHVVRLNGFIHTDDKLALREIWRQLGREMSIEDETSGRSNYADTLTSLLALLSHDPATDDPNAGDDEGAEGVTAKAVVFVLDEFDLFASHPRQTLLYNLFDIAQSRNAPTAVLGLTTKISVVEMLEKRVKSRFGQRFLHLSLPGRNFSTFTEMCKTALLPAKPAISAKLSKTGTKEMEALANAWTSYLDHVFTLPPFLTHLRSIHSTSASLSTFLTSCIIPITLLSPSCANVFAHYHPLTPPDSKLHLLPSLSELALSLLIAAARLDVVLDTDLCNFEMAYEEYVALAGRLKQQTSASGALAVTTSGPRIWSRSIARGAWEQLIKVELVLPASGGANSTEVGGGGTGRKGERGRMWRVDVALEEIAGSVPGLGAVMARWCKEI